MSVLFSAEVYLMTTFCNEFSAVFQVHFAQSEDVPPFHLMQELLQLACFSRHPNSPCSDGNFLFPVDFGISSIIDIPALVCEGERGYCDRW